MSLRSRRQFYALSRKLHPDRFAAKPFAEQEAALAQSSLLNDAYRTLKDPILRTQYLLTLEGVELEEQSKAATEAARATKHAEKTDRPPGPPRRGLRAQHAARRDAHGQEDGRRRPTTPQRPARSKEDLRHQKMAETQADLEQLWTKWDIAIETLTNQTAKTAAKDALVALLNRAATSATSSRRQRSTRSLEHLPRKGTMPLVRISVFESMAAERRQAIAATIYDAMRATTAFRRATASSSCQLTHRKS